MASDVTVRIEGSRKLAELGAAVRALGDDRTIFKTLSARLRKSLPGVKTKLQASAEATLPKAGGFGARVAGSSYRLSVRRGARTAGVSVVISGKSVKGKLDLFDLDESGTFRAPLFGNRHHWYPHVTESGFASTPWDSTIADEFATEVVAAVDDAIAQVGL